MMLETLYAYAVSHETLATDVVTFLVNYWVHSSIFLLMAFVSIRLHWLKGDAIGEMLLKSALLLGVFSAILMSVRPVNSDMTWRIEQNHQYTQVASLKTGLVFNTEAVRNRSQAIKQTGQSQSDKSGYNPQPIVGPHNIAGESASFDTAKAVASAGTLERVSFWLVFYWLICVFLMCALKCYQRYQLHKMMQHKAPLRDVMLLSGLASLKHQAGYKGDVALYSSSLLTSPVVLNSKQIVLPEVFVTQYSLAQQQAAMAHELAHLKRKDMHWQGMYQLFDILFFFQPLNKLIRREIHQIVEQRADDLASQWTGDPKALAEALSVTAKQQLGTRHTQWVLAMKCEKSNLLVRIENLLIGGMEKTKTVTIASLAMLWSTIIFLGPGVSLSTTTALPVIAAQQPEPAPNAPEPKAGASSFSHRSSPSSHSFSFSEVEDDYGVGNMSIAYSTDDTYWSLTSKLTGKIRFNDAESQIIFFPQDSELEVKTDDGNNKHRLFISRDKGATEYSYYVNRQQRDIATDPQWLAAFIPELLRMTGWNAKERTQRLFNEGGLTGVLDEILLIIGEEAKAKYLILLPELKTFSAQEVNLIFQSLGAVRSDYQKSRIVRSLFQNIRFEGNEWFTDENWRTLMEASRDIESDMEMARVMRSVVMAVPLDSEVWPEVLTQLQTVQSDFELARLLSELITHRPLQHIHLSEMLKLTRTIESDFELSNLLIHMAEHMGVPESVAKEWLQSVTTIQSDFEMSRCLKARSVNNVSDAELVQIIRLARNEIQSDFELASLFKVLIENQEIDGVVRDELYDSLSEIQSDHERQSVINELTAQNI